MVLHFALAGNHYRVPFSPRLMNLLICEMAHAAIAGDEAAYKALDSLTNCVTGVLSIALGGDDLAGHISRGILKAFLRSPRPMLFHFLKWFLFTLILNQHSHDNHSISHCDCDTYPVQLRRVHIR